MTEQKEPTEKQRSFGVRILIWLDHKIRGHDWVVTYDNYHKDICGEMTHWRDRECRVCGVRQSGHFSNIFWKWLWHED